MRLNSPQGLWFLLAVPPLILLYILKQKFEEKEISSLYLWQQVIVDMEASTPWQKLKKNLLFFIQLAALLLLILSITNPFVFYKGRDYENIIVVIDNSGSMGYRYGDSTRLDEAKARAEKLINSLPSKSKVTLITSSKNSKVEVSSSTDRGDMIRKIKTLGKTNEAGNINESYSLIKSIVKQFESYKVFYFTDHRVELKEINGEVVSLWSNIQNTSLDYIAHSSTGESLRVMIRATNHSPEPTTTEISLYGEGKILDIKKLQINGGETKTLYFDNVPSKYKYLQGEITEKDGLEEDNTIYTVVKQSSTEKVLLLTEKNIFLEKVLGAFKNIELFKTNTLENLIGEYDVYIFDGIVPRDTPKKGNILYVNPKENTEFFSVKNEVDGGQVKSQLNAVTRYVTNSDFVVSKFRPLEIPYWGSPLFKINNEDATFIGENKGRKIGAISFDLHNSDFPLTPEFPIFINNLTTFLTNKSFLGKTQYSCGDIIELIPLPDTEEIAVKNPQEETQRYNTKKSEGRVYEHTVLPGVYEISQRNKEEEFNNLIAINFPVSESTGGEEIENLPQNNKGAELSTSGINIQTYVLAMVFSMILLEWFIYMRFQGRK